jgi:hypothetical protein
MEKLKHGCTNGGWQTTRFLSVAIFKKVLHIHSVMNRIFKKTVI